MSKMNINAKIITGVKYTPLLCRRLNLFKFDEINKAINKDASFLLRINDKSQIAVSWWVSAKRTRSYPYVRVYDTLSFAGKKVTIIPIIKDEGKDGDRDFLQWDTISLMSLLGVYTIISYYSDAVPNIDYKDKITNQEFDYDYIKEEIQKLLFYQSDALHWNLSQIDKVGEIAKRSLDAYATISSKLGIEMHSKKSAENRVKSLMKGKETFLSLSRKLAKRAQIRESITVQPKERLSGGKATLTIKNYLGGNYYFTVDEFVIKGKNLYLVEGKHTEANLLPSLGDIKDGLFKMVLFTNLEDVKIENINYNSVPVLKLTTMAKFDEKLLNESQEDLLNKLKKEAKINEFKIFINDKFVM